MRVALCLSGHLRNFLQYSYNLTKFVLDPYKPDVFISLWDTSGWRLEGPLVKEDPDYKGFDYWTEQIDLDAVLNYLKPKSYIFENWATKEDFFLREAAKIGHLAPPPDHRPTNLLSMYYKIQNCNKLKVNYEAEHNFKYDIVIRSRFDTVYGGPLLPPLIIKQILGGTIITPTEYSHNGIGDIITLGNSEVINKFSNLLDYIPELTKHGVDMNPHAVLRYFLSKYFKKHLQTSLNVNVNRCRYNCFTSVELENAESLSLQCPSCKPTTPFSVPNRIKDKRKIAILFTGDYHPFNFVKKWWGDNFTKDHDVTLFLNLWEIEQFPVDLAKFPSLDPNSNSLYIGKLQSTLIELEHQTKQILITDRSKSTLDLKIKEGLTKIKEFEYQHGIEFDLVLLTSTNVILNSKLNLEKFNITNNQILVGDLLKIGNSTGLTKFIAKEQIDTILTTFPTEVFSNNLIIPITFKNRKIGQFSRYYQFVRQNPVYPSRFGPFNKFRLQKRIKEEDSPTIKGKRTEFGVPQEKQDFTELEFREPLIVKHTNRNRLKKIIPPKSVI